MQQLPPIFSEAPRPIADAAAAFAAAQGRYFEAHRNVGRAIAAANEAEAKRKSEVAAAVAKGSALGTDAKLRAAREAVDVAKRAVEEAEAQVNSAGVGVLAAVAANRDEWTAQLSTDHDIKVQAVVAAGAEFVAAVTDLLDVRSVTGWVDRAAAVYNEPGRINRVPALTEANLGHREPRAVVEAFCAWIVEGAIEPVRPPGGRAEAPAA